MVLKRFPDDYKPFLVVITQSEKQQTFSKFIVALQGFQDTEGAKTAAGDDSIMKATNNHTKSNQNAKETKNGITPVTNVANQVILNASVREKKLRLDTCVALVVVSHTVQNASSHGEEQSRHVQD